MQNNIKILIMDDLYEKIVISLIFFMFIINIVSFSIIANNLTNEIKLSSDIDELDNKIIIVSGQEIGKVKVDFYEHVVNDYQIVK